MNVIICQARQYDKCPHYKCQKIYRNPMNELEKNPGNTNLTICKYVTVYHVAENISILLTCIVRKCQNLVRDVCTFYTNFIL